MLVIDLLFFRFFTTCDFSLYTLGFKNSVTITAYLCKKKISVASDRGYLPAENEHKRTSVIERLQFPCELTKLANQEAKQNRLGGRDCKASPCGVCAQEVWQEKRRGMSSAFSVPKFTVAHLLLSRLGERCSIQRVNSRLLREAEGQPIWLTLGGPSK